MYIPNYVTKESPFCRLQLEVETFRHSTFEPTNENLLRVVKSMNKIYLLKKTLGTGAIDSPMSPPSLREKGQS